MTGACYSSKGVSGLFFQDRSLAANQTFVFDDWAAPGYYRSPVLTGTRSGGAIASAWAVAKYLGGDGYKQRAAQIFKARDSIVEAVEANRDPDVAGRRRSQHGGNRQPYDRYNRSIIMFE